MVIVLMSSDVVLGFLGFFFLSFFFLCFGSEYDGTLAGISVQ